MRSQKALLHPSVQVQLCALPRAKFKVADPVHALLNETIAVGCATGDVARKCRIGRPVGPYRFDNAHLIPALRTGLDDLPDLRPSGNPCRKSLCCANVAEAQRVRALYLLVADEYGSEA